MNQYVTVKQVPGRQPEFVVRSGESTAEAERLAITEILDESAEGLALVQLQDGTLWQAEKIDWLGGLRSYTLAPVRQHAYLAYENIRTFLNL